MARLSEVDAGTAEVRVDSLWSVLQRGIDFNPDRVALIAPSQPANHLQGLVGPATSLADYSTSPFAQARRAAAQITSVFSVGYLVSLLAPAPASLDCLTWTFAQLRRAAARLGYVLDANHIMPGATILVLVPSCAEWALLLWVSALKCCTLVTLDTTVLEPGHEQELQSYIEILAPSVIVARNQDDATAVERFRRKDKCPFMGLSLGHLAEPQQGWTSMEDISAMSFPANIKVEPALDTLDRVATIIFTSGTSTGSPKGCLRTVRDLVCPLDPSKVPPPLRPPIALVNTRNYLGIAPCLLYASWYTGNAAVLVGGSFSPATTLSAIATCRPIAISIAYPMILGLIVGHAEYSREKVRSVRYVQIIGSVTTVEGLRRAQEVFPNAKIVASYGMTEAASMFGWPQGPPKSQDIPSFRGIAASGTALPGIKLKIVDEKGHVLGRNEPGVLHLSGNTVTKGYLGGMGAEAFYRDNDSRWYITGDCAVLDDRGRIYILGRSDDMIRNDGITIAPATIENLLMKHFQSTVCAPFLGFVLLFPGF